MMLILPTTLYKNSFLELVMDLDREGHWYDGAATDVCDQFQAYLSKIASGLEGKQLEPGQVPYTEFWILVESTVVGRIRLNHQLSEGLRRRGGHIGYGISSKYRRLGYATKALALALQAAKASGLSEVLITCDDTNTGSIKVIETNGGIHTYTTRLPERTVPTRYYKVLL